MHVMPIPQDNTGGLAGKHGQPKLVMYGSSVKYSLHYKTCLSSCLSRLSHVPKHRAFERLVHRFDLHSKGAFFQYCRKWRHTIDTATLACSIIQHSLVYSHAESWRQD